jgi:hypothetical protein
VTGPDTLASARLGPGDSGLELAVLPGVRDALSGLRDAGVRIGILSDRGSVPAAEVEGALRRAELWPFLTPELVLYGRKDSPTVFEAAEQTARASSTAPPRTVLFVGEDAAERAVAHAADLDVCPAPLLARAVLDGRPLRYVRVRVPSTITGDWAARLRARPVVVLHASSAPSAAAELYAITDDVTALELDDQGFWVDRLGADDEPATSDLYVLRDDALVGGGVGAREGSARAAFDGKRSARRVLASAQDGLGVAVPAGRSVDSLHVGTPRHGHNLTLTPVPTLLEPSVRERLTSPPPTAELSADTVQVLEARELEIITREVRTSDLSADVERLQGVAPLDDLGAIASRHVVHPDNARAVRALASGLAQLGTLAVSTQRFLHQGRALDNVEALLLGRDLPGVVLVTAHLDSTASRDPGYRPDRDPAPGADDDASGVAAVLAVARAVLALDADLVPPRREVRSCCATPRNRAWSAAGPTLATSPRGEDLVGVFQLDMIGFDGLPGRTFELHSGFSSSESVEQGSRRLAQLLAAQRVQVAPALEEPQFYPGADGATDPAEQRSDHYSFQLHGFPAVLASEDFFVGPGTTSSAPDPNPNYHSPEDRTVDGGYAADITRLVAAATWLCATR